MRIPERWLRSFCDPELGTQALADLLSMSGLEVEAVEAAGAAFSGVVVAEVRSVERHPQADKLSVCRVFAGDAEVQVVCGAPNVRAGMKAPLARVGAKLPGLEIRGARLRGIDSQGMLASARELGLSEDHSGLLELAADAVPGTDLRRLLELDEQVLTLKLTPNRGDCLSILGVAREVAALTRTALGVPGIVPVPARSSARHPFRIEAPDGCGRFSGRVVRGVDARAPTPEWLKRRLERAGSRSISALVDVTNYVMLERGRPLHVYDLDKVRGAIQVRWGRAGEKVLLLNGQEVEVDPGVLCIADDSGVIGLAGIMGGESTKADENTKNVFLESAFFFPSAIQGRARRFNFTSDASHRFERGVDFSSNVEGIESATQLMLDLCGGEPGPTDDVVARLPERRPVTMRVARCQKIIGVDIPEDEMEGAFTRLGFSFDKRDGAFVVTPPSHRFDLEIEEDLIEEVARVYGFERIGAHPPRMPAVMLPAPEGRRSVHALRERMAGADYREVIHFSFVEPGWEADFAGESDPIRLLNPIASPLSVMRTSLLGSLVDTVRKNVSRKVERIRIFEAGRVFLRDPAAVDGPLSVAGVRQPIRIGAAAFGPADPPQWGAPRRAVDFFDVKADLEQLAAPAVLRFEAHAHPAFHPGRSARVFLGGAAIGWMGELHPKWQRKYDLPSAPVLFEVDAEPLQGREMPEPRVPSRFPPVVRDVAVLLDSRVGAAEILAALEAGKSPLVTEISIFDLYQGPNLPAGRKSLAFRVVIQDTERTLTDAEADAARDALVALLERNFAASLRS